MGKKNQNLVLFFCMFASISVLSACKESSDWEFSGSVNARYHIINGSTLEFTQIAVDVYKRKVGGEVYYSVVNSDGVRYRASRPTMIPAGYTHEVVNFRQGNSIGTLYIRP